jgi:ABC-type polysaccharide/polyol phosphate transport system ATPase subunit
MNMNNVAIRLINISKKYTIHHEKPTLSERLLKGKNEEFWALKNINITIKKGEKVGIIGPNGSGKTTLLKIFAGITTPTFGEIKMYGKIVSLIDLSAGFHPDLSGFDNIFLNGMLLGLKKDEITKKLTQIIKFADINQFIDAALFTYSSGMKLRLGFSISVHANPDILILDEELSVGDQQFQIKAQKKLQEIFSKGKTIIIVSHKMNFIEENCKRIIIINKGNIINDGGKEIIKEYETRFSSPETFKAKQSNLRN